MNNRKERRIQFPGRQTGEKVNLFFRRHPLSFFGFSLIGFIMVALPLVVFVVMINSGFLLLDGPLDYKVAVAIISAYLLFVMGMMIVAWMNFYLDVYIVTDKRLIDIHQAGLFSRNLSAVDLVDVEDVKADVKGLLATYFNFGTVDIQTAGELQNVQFTDVPEPYRLARKVMDYHEEAVREQREEAIKKVAQEEKEAEEVGGEVSPAPKKSDSQLEANVDSGEVKIEKEPDSTKIEEIDSDVGPKQGQDEQEDRQVNNKELKEGGEIDL